MEEEQNLNDFFEEENVEKLKDIELAKNYQRKIKRRFFKALFGFAFIVFLPVLFPHQSDFDVVHNAFLFQVVLVGVFVYTVGVFLLAVFQSPRKDEAGRKSILIHYSIMDFTNFLVGVFAFFTIINTFFFSFTSVALEDSESMVPTIYPGDQLIIRHYDSSYQRHDIVVAKIDTDLYYLKRLIGLPGDTITCENNRFVITPRDGETFVLDEPYLDRYYGTCDGDLLSLTVPDDHYYIIGDNRAQSSDSRNLDVGLIPHHRMHGKVVFRVTPIREFGGVE